MIIRDFDPDSPAFIATAVEAWADSEPVSVSLEILSRLDLLHHVEGRSGRRLPQFSFGVRYEGEDGELRSVCTPRELHRVAREALGRHREAVRAARERRGDPSAPLPVVIRKTTPNDFELLSGLLLSVPELEDPLDCARRLITPETAAVSLLAENEGDAVAAVQATYEGRLAELRTVVVHPRVRGRAVGRHLLFECGRILHLRGVAQIAAYCGGEAAFLRRCGFEEGGEVRRFNRILRPSSSGFSRPNGHLSRLEVLSLHCDALRTASERVRAAFEAEADRIAGERCPFRIGEGFQCDLFPGTVWEVIEVRSADFFRSEAEGKKGELLTRWLLRAARVKPKRSRTMPPIGEFDEVLHGASLRALSPLRAGDGEAHGPIETRAE